MIIEADRISFAYRGQPVLRGVTFQARAGELVGIFGPNGSGKTTLLRCLNGALMPQAGEVRVDGRPVACHALRELARRVAVVPQDSPSDLAYTAREVVLLGRYPHLGLWGEEGDEDREAARRAMEETATWPLRDRLLCELSGGERQRVIIAKALAQEPSALLLDEPALHLDLCHQLALYSLVQRLAQTRLLCVVMVCHDLFLAPAYLSRAVLLHNGSLVADGPPGEVISRDSLASVFGVTQLPPLWAALPALRG